MDISIPQWMVDIVLWIVHLFTPAEWKAGLWLVVATLAFTHFAKIAWRLSPLKGGGTPAAIHLLAGLVGFFVAIPIWPDEQVPWWIAGPVLGGGGAIGVFKIAFPLLKLIFPKLAAAVNVDRRKDVMPIPPVNMPERRDDLRRPPQ